MTDGVFVPIGDAATAFLPAPAITRVHLAALTERVRRCVIRWFRAPGRAVTALAIGNLGRLADAAASLPLPRGEGRDEGASAKDEQQTHLNEPLEPPLVSSARGPPTDWGELVQVHDDRDVF